MDNIKEKQINILVVDDNRAELFLITSSLKKWGYSTVTAGSGDEALDILAGTPADIIISDQNMPGMDGMQLLHSVRELYEHIPFIMVTAYADMDKAVFAMRQGAYDYIEKPYSNPDNLRLAVERAMKYRNLSRETGELKRYLADIHGFQNIITESPAMIEAVKLASKVAGSPDTAVAIYGESGVGKELLARAIHHASGCAETRFVGMNCAAVPQGLLESELFGCTRGAFTGADADREGRLGMAQDGTLLLDEIGDMPCKLQPKLLRVLEERTYEKIGSDRKMETNARIITTTHRNLEEMVKQGRFREDLLHRINSFPIVLPPLRERRNDIPLLADYFFEEYRQKLGKYIPGISTAAMMLLSEYHWPGNVRELKNCLERAVIINNGELIRPSHLTLRRKVERAGDYSTVWAEFKFQISNFKFQISSFTNFIQQGRCNMPQDSVERFLGRLLTDDDFRERVMSSFNRVCFEEGFELTVEEKKILRKTDFEKFAVLAGIINGGIKINRRVFRKNADQCSQT